eukprot:CAMPEP_0183787018 /NCGR_PEP_ID=MMETSP0739-20130205/67326_1 /TAXON_ID=385413 /ORGANISM="Thalassiosira miniscula, Strain CCMP1093" /LENGTH=532 /DNA_ID=CAMNT_0026031087 /DNA_START=448 /DNA_END=2043 /DNA_ORIENTATION=-
MPPLGIDPLSYDIKNQAKETPAKAPRLLWPPPLKRQIVRGSKIFSEDDPPKNMKRIFSRSIISSSNGRRPVRRGARTNDATKRWSSGDDNNNNINHNERDELAKSDTDLDFRLGESLFPEILSIPLSIHPNNSNHQGEGQHGDGPGDAAEDCQSTNSLMSEVTFMTYSDEKAEMIRDEFFRQVKLQTKALSVQERESLLERVEREQKIKFDKKLERTRKKHQRHMEKQEKKKQQKHQPSWSSPNKNNKKGNNTQKISEDYDLLKKLRAFKMGETTDEIDGGEPQQQLTLSSRTNNNKRDSKGSPSASATKKKSAIKRTASAESCSSYATAKLSNKISSTRSNTMNDNNDISHLLQQPAENLQNLQNLYTPAKNSSQIARERGDKEEIGGLEQTTVQHQHQEQVSPHQATAITAPASNRTSLRTESSSIKASITDIIELKLLVANQQSLIDTLSSKIHNLEVANRQLHLLQDSTINVKEEAAANNSSNNNNDYGSPPPSSRKVMVLQAENANLEQQLNECRQREIGLRNELFS